MDLISAWRPAPRGRRGIALIYALVAMVAIVMMISLAVDLGRVQVAKTELQRAADAAARYAAMSLAKGSSTTAARNNAISAAGQNLCDGSPVALSSSDVSFGRWNASSKTFTVASSNINAIRIRARRTGTSGIPLLFARLVGPSRLDVTATAIAQFTTPVSVNQNIPATGNPFLAGMPNGTMASAVNPNGNPDFAGTSYNLKNSPIQTTMSVTEGQVITFDSISGNAANGPGITDSGPDGNTSDVGHNNLTANSANNYSSNYYNENGIADARIPINATVGVFLSDARPDLTPAPSENLDFSTSQSRDYLSISPKLKQVFFIGDGRTSDGQTQEIVVPAGATRFFVTTWDFYEWSNNSGSRNVVINRPARITLVQ